MDENYKTIISDTFPLDKLECQYFEECKFYDHETCAFGEPCKTLQKFNGLEQTVRSIFRQITELYVSKEDLKYQIKLIISDDKT
jgi:hypothetical protein